MSVYPWMQPIQNDPFYSITLRSHNAGMPNYVVRYKDEYLSEFGTLDKAIQFAKQHKTLRLTAA